VRVVSQLGQRKYLWDETDVRNDGSEKFHFLSDLRRASVLGVPWIRCGLVFNLTTSLIFSDGSLHSSLTLVLVTSWQMPTPVLALALGSLIVLILITVLVILLRRRGRRNMPSRPFPIASVPSLESSDGAIYFRLDGLDNEGLIIGRGKHGVDLPIEESMPYADTVSSRHARIYYDTIYGHVIIEDLDSTNGIYINGRQAPRKNLLKDGWVVGLGRLNLTYHDGESDTGPLDG
jgi:hypothetical protein